MPRWLIILLAVAVLATVAGFFALGGGEVVMDAARH